MPTTVKSKQDHHCQIGALQFKASIKIPFWFKQGKGTIYCIWPKTVYNVLRFEGGNVKGLSKIDQGNGASTE